MEVAGSVGGTKYWIFIAVAVPATVLIIAFFRPFSAMRHAVRDLQSEWKR
jgi:hypothetical protein